MPDEGGDNFVIRTMKDDLAPKPASPALPAEALAKAGPPAPTTLPLAPRSQTPAPPLIPAPFQTKTPNLARRNRRRVFTWVAVALTSAAALGGGLWGFVTYFSASPTNNERPSQSGNILPAAVPIPHNASVAIHYGSLTPDVRSRWLTAWSNSPDTLLQGNPKTLLANSLVNQFIYVALEGDSRPYLLIPKSEMDSQQLALLSSTQVTEYNGLYILHTLNAANYITALQQTTAVNPLTEQLDDTDHPYPLRIYLGQGALNHIRREAAGEAFAGGSLTQLLLSADLSPNSEALVFENAQGTPSGALDTSLLTSIPSDARFVRLSSNLAADAKAWENLLDKNILERPAVAALLGHLTQPYAYYQRDGEDSVKDIGLITSIPAEISPPLGFGDASLEEALRSLIPLITGNQPVAANIAFADGTYKEIPLRFLNISGSTQALDYTLQAGKLIFASSKEGMFAALDPAAPNPSWEKLIRDWRAGGFPEVYLGYLTSSPLRDLLPAAIPNLSAAVGKQSTPSGPRLSGMILLSL